MNAAGQRTVDYACEEAAGIACAPHLVDDKDGIATAVMIAAWAAELKAAGITLGDELDNLHRTYGVYTGTQIAARTNDPDALITPWVENPPSELAGIPLDATTLPETNGVVLSGHADAGDVRITVRASGTEPKVKLYVEVSKAEHRVDAEELLTRLTEAVNERVRVI